MKYHSNIETFQQSWVKVSGRYGSATWVVRVKTKSHADSILNMAGIWYPKAALTDLPCKSSVRYCCWQSSSRLKDLFSCHHLVAERPWVLFPRLPPRRLLPGGVHYWGCPQKIPGVQLAASIMPEKATIILPLANHLLLAWCSYSL